MHHRYFIATEAPDFSKIPDTSAPCPSLGWPNLLYAVDSKVGASPRQTGPLSIKTTLGGREIYETDAGRFAVDRSHWLVLNEGEEYDHEVIGAGDATSSSFCIFFQSGFPAELMRESTASEEDLLDLPEEKQRVPEFLEMTYRVDDRGIDRQATGTVDPVTPVLSRMSRELFRDGTIEGMKLGEYYRLLFRALLQVNGVALRQLAGITAARRATRIERLRRVRLAHDYMLDNFSEPLSLEEVASAASLSPYHFLRTFREAFGETPHQFLTARRLEHARHLLRETDLPVAAICYDVGFESPSSFTSLFRRRVGTTPLLYRMA